MRWLIPVGLGLTATMASASGPIESLEALGRTLRREAAWQARYQQVYVPTGMTSGDEAEGRVWVAWPDRARFVAESPAAREMALEGRRVRLVDRDLESCDDHVVSDGEWERIPLAVVLDPRGAVDRFTVTSDEDGAVVMLPRDGGGVARVVLKLGADGLPAEVEVVDVQGASNRLRFDGWIPAEGPPEARWLPAPPAGVECQNDLGSSATPE